MDITIYSALCFTQITITDTQPYECGTISDGMDCRMEDKSKVDGPEKGIESVQRLFQREVKLKLCTLSTLKVY